ncbi:proton-conducting transporter membrane subunit [Oxalobacteraceae bacterium R-40]|uniref:Proton-conducting transporter membrane subunit n=1 Tax=Keguizhuia sedimenti TaxID=3064264 RepID=A0ABU1BRI9_9BURK|nr:proton-conducting transporter membrane subunit [Oxalobacteraceae bacterium R-40]
MIDPLPWLILLPLFWGTAAFLLGPGRGAALACTGTLAQLFLCGWLAVSLAGHERVYEIGGWTAPLGIELLVDGLSVIILCLVQIVALPVAMYAQAYFSVHEEGVKFFWPLLGYLLAGMNALLLSADLFNLYVALELVSLSAVGLVASKGAPQNIAAALRYLLATLLGSGAYLLGVALFYGAYGTVSMSLIGAMVDANAPNAIKLAAGLMVAGLMLKTALFPFHFWLPPAHGGASAPVSALLSALVIKVSFYLIVRLWTGILMPIVPTMAAQLCGLLGALAILWGSFQALRQTRLKMLIAYSTVAQIGYLFLFFPLAVQSMPLDTQSAFQGVVLQALAHGLAKAAMFAAAGALILSTDSDEIAQLGGVSSHLPMPLFTFGLAGVTLMGLPPTSGFLAKWLLIDGALSSGQWAWIVIIISGGLFTAAYVFKVLRHAFVQVGQSKFFRPLPAMIEWPAFFLAVASVGLGLGGNVILKILGNTT